MQRWPLLDVQLCTIKKFETWYGLLPLARKHRKLLFDTGLDALETASIKIVHKAAQATGEFIGNKIADKIVKPKPVIDENSRNLEQIIISPETKRRNIKGIKSNC